MAEFDTSLDTLEKVYDLLEESGLEPLFSGAPVDQALVMKAFLKDRKLRSIYHLVVKNPVEKPAIQEVMAAFVGFFRIIGENFNAGANS